MTDELNAPILSPDPDERKNTPVFSGFINYFPLAIAAVARLSKRGNDKHNPGQPLHWAREKSTDHADCIARLPVSRGSWCEPDGGDHEDAYDDVWPTSGAV